jgi:hypothetical protein
MRHLETALREERFHGLSSFEDIVLFLQRSSGVLPVKSDAQACARQ